MKIENLKIKSNFDGLELDTLIYIPEKEIKGIVQLAHGMCEYKGRYLGFLEVLANNGYVACINDHRGHGKSVKSKEDLGYFYDKTGEAIVDDCHQITLYLKERFPNLPITLFGHSMGSFVVRAYARKYDKDIDKLIVCGSPSYNPACGVGVVLIDSIALTKGDRYISKTITAMTIGAYDKAFPEEGHNSWIAANKQSVIDYENDELCGFSFTLNGNRNLLLLMKAAYSKDGWKMDNPDMPILFVSGEDDPCAESKEKWLAAIENMKSHGYKNVTGKMYKGCRHEILGEVIKDEVHKDILDFIK